MTRRRRLTDQGVRALKPGPKRRIIPDPECLGHYVRLQPTGVRSFVAVARDPYGTQIWTTIGSADHLTIEDSRAKAREVIKRVKAGQDAFEPPPPKNDSFRQVAENWFKRHVEAKGLRSRVEIRRTLERYLYPTLAEREFTGIRKADITKLLDHVEDAHGARQADAVLAYLSGIMNWHAARTDDYAVPLSRGMRRTSMRDRARRRILDDGELQAVWRRAEASGPFGGMVKLLILTAQRLDKVAAMKWDHVTIDGVWHIATEAREKGNGGSLVLPEKADEIIRRQPRIEGNPHVFAGRGGGYLRSYTKLRRAFDAGLPPMPNWVLHDLRRTARSLMGRAGVRPDIAERVLGHVQAGVQGTYDRHSYLAEKADALRKLAALAAEIIDGAPDKVVPMRARP